MAEPAGSMRAVIMERLGKARVLIPTRLNLPRPAANEVLVKVHATSVNPSDLLLRGGRLLLRKPLPHILGADLAGEIAQLGDRVCAAFEGLGCEIDGGYAEYCLVPADKLVKMPDELDYPAAVAAGAAFASAYRALITRGGLRSTDTVVIRGAAGSIGTAAVQIAASRCAKVIAISQGCFAADLRAIGADIVLEDRGEDLARQVQVATDELGANLLLHCQEQLDPPQSLSMLRDGGSLIIASALAKSQTRLNAMDLYQRNLSLRGAYGTCEPKEFEACLLGLASGEYHAVINELMPLSRARQAHQKLEKTPGFGKIVLAPDAVLEAAKKPANWIPID